MIGHVFASSGAVCLALAPSAERPDEYVVLARTENGYAVARLLTEMLTRDPLPDYWLRASYFDRAGGDAADRWEAAVAFGGVVERVDGLADAALTALLDRIVATVEHAEQVAAHRAHLAGR